MRAKALLSLALGLVLTVAPATRAQAQSVLARSPNLQGVWGLDPWRATFVLSHRFEIFEGGDELTSIPTITLGVGLPAGFTVGIDATTFSESIRNELAGNERQVWLKHPFSVGPVGVSGMVAYNTAAKSVDGAVDIAYDLGRLSLFAEGRAFSDQFASGDAGTAGAIGGALRLTRYIGLAGDIGRVTGEDSIPAAWSAALAMEIPASPHSVSLQVTNTGATTLQGASRKKTFGSQGVRYGFAFTVVMGGSGRWSRLFEPVRPAPVETPEVGVVRVDIRDFAFAPAELHVRMGQTVEWINRDAVGHTATGTSGGWGSPLLAQGESYRIRFEQAGTYDYYCGPHPQMRGRVVVE